VDSVLVGFERHEEPGDENLRVKTFAVIDGAFGQRRKMLRQALAGYAGSSAEAIALLEKAGIDPTLRGEQLGIADFVSIAQAG
jgi:16S rRNA (adenine1518-N6/adenine1519-N6)-dimethyltransferase